MTRHRGPWSLRGRLTALLLVALAVAQIASFALFFGERSLAVRAVLANEAADRTLQVAEALDGSPSAMRAVALQAAESRGFALSLGKRPATSAEHVERLDSLARRVAGRLGVESRTLRMGVVDEGDDHHERDGRARWRNRSGDIIISVALADGAWLNARAALRRAPIQIAWPAAASALLTALVVIAAVWLGAGRIAEPMRALAAAADRLGAGARPEALPLVGPSEVRRVTDSFNRMAERMTRLLDERARMLAAIGHDLRSPITAMRLRLEMVEDDETRERLTVCVDEIHSLVEAALALARGIGTEEPSTRIEIGALLRQVSDELRETGAVIDCATGREAIIEGRRGALRRALRNVMENAIRYGGGGARVALKQDATALTISIDDDGPGVPVSERARIFDPFVRLEASRNRDTGGAGLGLSIARAAIEAHRGRITVGDAPGGGARFEIMLPLAAAD